jgi:hypothetical protein
MYTWWTLDEISQSNWCNLPLAIIFTSCGRWCSYRHLFYTWCTNWFHLCLQETGSKRIKPDGRHVLFSKFPSPKQLCLINFFIDDYYLKFFSSGASSVTNFNSCSTSCTAASSAQQSLPPRGTPWRSYDPDQPLICFICRYIKNTL